MEERPAAYDCAVEGGSTRVEQPDSRFDGKVVCGKDGWLFLDSDSNHTIEQHLGRLRFTEGDLLQWQSVLENRFAWLRQRGIPYFFLVAPNPHSVYPEKLPPMGSPEGPRPILQLLEHLDRHSYARLIYPIDELWARKDDLVYSATNTHWTDRGAFVGYRALADEIGDSVPMRRLNEDDLHWHEIVSAGDLGQKLRPPESSPSVFAEPRQPEAQFVHDNRVVNNGRRIDYECGAAPRVKCLVLGDSFADILLPFMAESFRHLVYAHIYTLDYELVREESPDVVVSLMNERFLFRIPHDIPARTLREWEEEKRATGDLYPPRRATTNRVDSPTLWGPDQAGAQSL
jgi:alginate O-acetyltransferase complex protein AlgJ